MLRELDWNTTLGKATIGDHWRAVLCAFVGAVLATFAWCMLYPHTHGFEKLWMGLTTGASAGMIPGAIWQLWSCERRPSTSGWFLAAGILGWGTFAVFALFQMAPDLAAQERERAILRALDAQNISAVSIHIRGHNIHRIENNEALALFVKYIQRAELFYPSHEQCITEFVMVIYRKNGEESDYEGCVPERHPSDFLLTYRAYFSVRDVLVPGGQVWLEKYGF